MDVSTHDLSRHDAADDDDKYMLAIDAVADRYVEAGHPRTIRTLQRYCANGHLDCLKQPTALGDMYRVTPSSVARHLAELDQLSQATGVAIGRDQARPSATDDVPEPQDNLIAAETTTSHDQPRHVATEPNAMSRYVERLEDENTFLREQIGTKDEQIKDLTERSRETNHLIGGLQRMLAPLLKSPDPFPHAQTIGEDDPLDRAA